jgi:hypothetical protein
MPFLSKKELLKEHKRLIPLLKSGSTVRRKKEAAIQSAEMIKLFRRI